MTAVPAEGGIRTAAAAAGGWDELAARIGSCVACAELVRSRTSVVVGTAPAYADLLLVGEAPGATEDKAGHPFLGASGRLLDRLLAEAGICRDTAAVVNVVKCRPPGNRPPTRREVARCVGWLDRQVELVEPRLVCTLGATAAAWAFGPGTRIGALRGRVHRLHDADGGRPAVATYHPSAALRFGPAGMPMAALRADLTFVARQLAELRA